MTYYNWRVLDLINLKPSILEFLKNLFKIINQKTNYFKYIQENL